MEDFSKALQDANKLVFEKAYNYVKYNFSTTHPNFDFNEFSDIKRLTEVCLDQSKHMYKNYNLKFITEINAVSLNYLPIQSMDFTEIESRNITKEELQKYGLIDSSLIFKIPLKNMSSIFFACWVDDEKHLVLEKIINLNKEEEFMILNLDIVFSYIYEKNNE